ncbi:MAG: serine/threonine protein kinase [Planctomycetales bacterium]|nr:serine/threonine protein kinase [Planctomycetales bacterium]
MESTPGRIGPYALGAELGRGGFAVVYRARHEGTGAEVALKVASLQARLSGPVPLLRFRREVELVHALDHPGIVRVLASGEGPEGPWFAMELVEGESLWATLRREPLPWRRACEIARDVADALAAAHARGILHRDVKPGNILVGRKGADEDVAHRAPANAESAFLTDFGLAKDLPTGSRLTVTGTAVGTPDYMSPEQACGDTDSLTPATDVWGVGAVLYEMVAGRPPFDGETPEEIVAKVILERPVPLRRLAAHAPRGLARVVACCLSKRPAARYPDAAALRDDLDRVLRGERPRARGRARLVAMVASTAAAPAIAWAAWAGPAGRGPSRIPPPAEAPAPSRAEALAERARAVRATAPAEAARLLAGALASGASHPSAHAWRLERGLLLWGMRDGPGAVAEWERVPDSAPESGAALFYRGFEAVGRLDGNGAVPLLERAARGESREARLARAALAVMTRNWPRARAELASASGWEASLLRGYLEHLDPRGDRPAAVREYGAALAEGPPLAWVRVNRGAMRNTLGDNAGAIE